MGVGGLSLLPGMRSERVLSVAARKSTSDIHVERKVLSEELDADDGVYGNPVEQLRTRANNGA